MMSSDDDDVEPRVREVDNYYFVDDNDTPISLDALPLQFDADEKVPSFKRDVYLRGFSDGGLQKVYKQVVAWKLGLVGVSPEITVLSTEGSWIVLLKPRPSYEELVRSLLITVEMLYFIRTTPTGSEKNMWDHLRGVFNKFLVRPSEDDFKNHQPLIKLFAIRDPALANSQILQAFLKDSTTEKTNEIGSSSLEVEKPFLINDDEIEEMVEEDTKHEPSNWSDGDDEGEEELFDSVCAICDNGGDLLCCEGLCMRSFHAKVGDGEDSYCATLGYTEEEVKATHNFVCKNCEHKKHQCFVCGELGPSDENAKVFLCNNATCGHFYHPKCVAPLLHPNNRSEASELEKKISSGFSFTCPVHWCFHCKGLEDRTQEPLQFAFCRRCPKSYHRKCLPREISFEEIEELGVIIRAWELSKRMLIYCLDHEMDLDLGTPARDHIKFPHADKSVDSVKKKVKKLAGKKRQTSDCSYVDESLQKNAKLPGNLNAKDGEKASRDGTKSFYKQHAVEPEKKKRKYLKETAPLEASSTVAARHRKNSLKQHAVELEKKKPKYLKETAPHEASSFVAASARHRKQPGEDQKQELGTLSSPATDKTPLSSFPIVDSETEMRVIALVDKKEVSSLTIEDISRRCVIPSTYATSGTQIDKIIARGKLEQSVQAVHAALQILENGGTIEDAKAVCEPEILRQLTRWNNKLRVYLAPFIHGMRYTSLGRHFTKKDKLIEIVDKLHWYVQPGDTIVDFSCGLNDFSQFMKEKLDKVGKRCNFKNYDVIQPKNSFCFEKRDWMTVRPKELPHGSKLIMGLNPPFGLKAILANKFIDKALTFKPKLIILIVPEETERLDRKRLPYDLVWEDNQSLSGKSFYLPGSLDVSDKQMDQWNVFPPILYLWSHPCWTEKHNKIAEKHGHTEIFEDVSHASEEWDYPFDDFPTQNHAKATYVHNSTSGKERTYVDQHMNFAIGKHEQVDGFPPEKQVEVAYEETKVASNRSNTCRAYQNHVHHKERYAHTEYRIASHIDGDNPIEISNCSVGRRESEKTGEGDDAKADSDMSIAPSNSMNAQYESSSLFAPMPSESEYPPMMAHQDNYLNHPVTGLCVFKNHLAFSTENTSPGIEEQQRLYDFSSKSGRTGGSFYERRDFEDRSMDCTTPGVDVRENARMHNGHISNDNPQTAMNPPASDIRAQIRMYGGHVRDDHPQTAMNSPGLDIREQIRMYGGQSTYDHPHTGRHYSGSSDARFKQSASTPPSYGVPSLDSTGRPAIDNYSLRFDEANYNPGQRAPYIAPDHVNFVSRQQYPYPPPGSSGGWLG